MFINKHLDRKCGRREQSDTPPLNSLHTVTIHSLSLLVSYQMTRAREIKSTLEWIISNSNENIMCS